MPSGRQPPGPTRGAVSSDAQLEQEIAALRDSYRARLPSMVEDLAADADAARCGGGPGALARARARAHRLHGTVGSYGLHVEATLLREVELALESIERREAEPAEAWPRAAEALAALRARLAPSGA